MCVTPRASVLAAAAAAFLAGAALAFGHDAAVQSLVAGPGIEYLSVPKAGKRPAAAAADLNVATANYQVVHAVRGATRTNPHSAAAALGLVQRRTGRGGAYANVTAVNAYGTQYAVQVAFHDTPLLLLLDTGSADTWAVREGFYCLDVVSGGLTDAGACGFGPPYRGGFQYGAVADEHLYVGYASGEVALGAVGRSDVTVGAVTVERQQVGLANVTRWLGNGRTSGVLGLAYPALTNAYTGNLTDHDWADGVPYSPVFTSMVNDGLVAPYFSLAVGRNASDGRIGWGGIPPVEGLDWATVATTDIIITRLQEDRRTAWQYSFYTILVDGVRWGSTTDARRFPFIVDSGTTLLYLPPDISDSVAAAFRPPAQYSWSYGAYLVDCDAQAPLLAVLVGGVALSINPRDLVYDNVVDPDTGLCLTGIADGGDGPYVLGDVFLQNVLAVFDVGGGVMRFVAREYY